MRTAAASSLFVGALILAFARPAAADETAPSLRAPRGRLCCALATNMPLHLGATHVPLALGQIGAVPLLGRHSYTGWASHDEGNGLIYTRRGGFIDLGHTRDYADLTAYFTVHLRPLLEKGSGSLEIQPLLGGRKVVIDRAVPAERLAATTVLVARRAAFEMSIWTEIVQFYGRRLPAEEVYSAFTPDDLYSDLLGTFLGAEAVTSARPYDDAMTDALKATLQQLGAMSSADAERTLYALAPRWWHRDTPWPSPDIAVLRSFNIGPTMTPVRAPADVVPTDAPPFPLQVPERDAAGAPLASYFHVELTPDPTNLAYFTQKGMTTITSADLPAIVDGAHAYDEATNGHVVASLPPESGSPLTHYQNGLRMVEINGSGGLQATHGGKNDEKGAGGGGFAAVLADTRAGDFHVVRVGVGNTDRRGVNASAAIFTTDVVYFCHDPETRKLHAPLVSLLGPCAPGEVFGIGGSVGEALHDGKTGRTALRPVSAYGVLNVLGNGQSRSYDRYRVLLRGGGALEHYWSVQDHADFVPRVGGQAILMARTEGGAFEARGTSEYRIDPSAPEDAGMESAATVRWYFLLGEKEPVGGAVDGIDPWGVGSLGLTAGMSWFSRPLHSFADAEMAPWVSADRRVTFQALVNVTLGFEGLAF